MNKINIEQFTADLLSELKIDSLPVPVEQIAESLGMIISYAPSKEYSGMLVRKKDGSGKVLVGINSAESRERQRFTIAHEIGHYFMHKNMDVSIDYRMSYNAPKPKKEKEADDFAANLLMPKEKVIKDFKKVTSERKIFFEKDLAYLAKKYAVSSEAMKIRLSILNLI